MYTRGRRQTTLTGATIEYRIVTLQQRRLAEDCLTLQHSPWSKKEKGRGPTAGSVNRKPNVHLFQCLTDRTVNGAQAFFFFPPPLAFLITPPLTLQKCALRESTTSGAILHTCFFGARRSSSFNDSNSVPVAGNCFNAGHRARDSSFNRRR